ncbi:hypothetical protein HK097_006711, partial [Rhizophlyctis rosea]
MPTLEKQILDHVGHFIRKEKYQPSAEEQECIKSYDRTPVYYTVGNFLLWGSVAILTIDFRSLLYGDPPTAKPPGATIISTPSTPPAPPAACPVTPKPPTKPRPCTPACPTRPPKPKPRPPPRG